MENNKLLAINSFHISLLMLLNDLLMPSNAVDQLLHVSLVLKGVITRNKNSTKILIKWENLEITLRFVPTEKEYGCYLVKVKEIY